MVQIIDNSGTSLEDAIVILDAASSSEGVRAEYEYLEQQFGIRGINWNLQRQALLHIGDKVYDEMTVLLPNNDVLRLYFDITDFFGKM